MRIEELGIRERWEALEQRTLSVYARKSAETKGRQRPEAPDPIRTEFQRDRDRIIHSKAFRRLKHKTQVLFAPQGDHYRTRLTHTLEVTQIARTIGRALRLNEDLIEAIGLGHDLGHTPFGHSGERALDALSQKYLGVPFRHYEQSLRVVDVLEKDGQGLNLTYEVREGILHHSKGQKDLREGETSESLEGQCVRVADRIAYVNHDLDDAIRAGILRAGSVPRALRKRLGETHSERIARLVGDVIQNSWESPVLKMSESMMDALDEMKDFLFQKVYLREEQREEWKKAERMIRSLFEYFMTEGIEGWTEPGEESRERARKVVDYIAGMTDIFVVTVFEGVFVPRRWGY
jgi:dGTPase